jgi:hypothetical protein
MRRCERWIPGLFGPALIANYGTLMAEELGPRVHLVAMMANIHHNLKILASDEVTDVQALKNSCAQHLAAIEEGLLHPPEVPAEARSLAELQDEYKQAETVR